MKRTMTALILLLLIWILPAAALCESPGIPTIRETIAMEQPSFSFRGGIRWGMTPELVRSIETEAMTEKSGEVWTVMVTADPVAVSRFSADLVFIFQNNALKMITYEFYQDVSSLYYQYLIGALSSVYGDGQEAQPATVKALMDLIYPGRFSLEKIRQPVVWTHADGTHIYLYYFTDTNYAILYTSPGLGSQGGGYVVDGL